MKKLICLAICSMILLGCNMNPSKEARLQQLEKEVVQTMDMVKKLEAQLKVLKLNNDQLQSRVAELEL